MKLNIELVPKSSWGNNLRDEANLSKSSWDKLRKECYKKAGYVCEVCGGKGSTHPVECHEIWSYDDQKNIQKLEGLIALCPLCHKAKHLGRTLALKVDVVSVMTHLSIVNGLSVEDMEKLVQNVFKVWSERSGKKWILDLSWLEGKL